MSIDTGISKITIGLGMTLFALLANTAVALPITYDIGAGTAPGFSGSWLHSGAVEMGDSGYFANGDALRISGQLMLDLETASASGTLTGSGDFGQGYNDWTLLITGASVGTYNFVGGETDLISLTYQLTSADDEYDFDGIFHFADRDFNGGDRDDGPNYISNDYLYLWGNNWVNAHGSEDRETFTDNDGIALGLDLYGERASVPEPGITLLLLTGLLGTAAVKRVQSKRRQLQ